MTNSQIKLNAILTDRILYDKAIRVNPVGLDRQRWLSIELSEDYIAGITQALGSVTFLTPVLIDCNNRVFAGQGLVEAAIRIGAEKVSAFRLKELNSEERKIYIKSLRRYFDVVGLDNEVFLAEAHQILSLVASDQAANDKRSGESEMIPA